MAKGAVRQWAGKEEFTLNIKFNDLPAKAGRLFNGINAAIESKDP